MVKTLTGYYTLGCARGRQVNTKSTRLVWAVVGETSASPGLRAIPDPFFCLCLPFVLFFQDYREKI